MFNNFNGMEQLIIVFTCQSFTPKLSKAYTALKKNRDEFEVRCFCSLVDVCSYCTVRCGRCRCRCRFEDVIMPDFSSRLIGLCSDSACFGSCSLLVRITTRMALMSTFTKCHFAPCPTRNGKPRLRFPNDYKSKVFPRC